MDYQKHYDLLIETRRNRILENNGYYEKHHIIPKSMGGTNKYSNLICLTAREHFIAHWLLWRIHKNQSMAFAFFLLSSDKKSSRAYQEAKEIRSNFVSKNNTLFKKGKPISIEHLKAFHAGLNLKPRSEKHRKNISLSLSGKSKSLEHRKNLSNSLKGFVWSEERNLKISKSKKGKGVRQIRQTDLNGNEIFVFKSLNECLDYINSQNEKIIPISSFCRYLNQGKTVIGYKWERI